MDRPTCRTCPYWDSGGEEDSGICRKSCPKTAKPQYEGDYSAFPVWPITLDTEWCGEHPDFPAYLASLKKPPESTDSTEWRAYRGELSVRAIKTLTKLDVATLEGIAKLDYRDIMEIQNCGMSTVCEIRKFLAKHGHDPAWPIGPPRPQNGTPVSSGASPSG